MTRLAALLVLMAGQAGAQPAPCFDRAMVAERLSDGYGETQFFVGELQDGLLEVWISERTGTWTLLLTTPNGLTCVLSSGTGWSASALGQRS